jgi:hypothetical protein
MLTRAEKPTQEASMHRCTVVLGVGVKYPPTICNMPWTP